MYKRDDSLRHLEPALPVPAGGRSVESQIFCRFSSEYEKKEVSIGIAKTQVSTISRGVLLKCFNEMGSGKDLKRRLEYIS